MMRSGIMCDKISYMQFSPYGAVVEMPSIECSFHAILTSFLDFFCHTLYLKRIFFIWVLKVAGGSWREGSLSQSVCHPNTESVWVCPAPMLKSTSGSAQLSCQCLG